MDLSSEEQKKQIYYRDARFTDQYDSIWQSVGKCVFCDLRDKYIFFEEHGIVMTVSLFAYIDGHFMIVPRRHVRSVKELTQKEWETIRKFTYIAKKLVRDVHDTKGMQLVQKDGSNAQSTVNQHLHFHCIPFDAPDLSVWNYRKLQYTPLENASLYRKARKKIIKARHKFDTSYQHPSSLPVVCDAVIINEKNEVLLQKRSASVRMLPNHDTLPGGIVNSFEHSLEEELVREIREETGLPIDASSPKLIDSRISRLTYARTSTHLEISYGEDIQCLWNTYLISNIVKSTDKLTPGDDAQHLYWLPLDQVSNFNDLTPELQQAILKAAL